MKTTRVGKQLFCLRLPCHEEARLVSKEVAEWSFGYMQREHGHEGQIHPKKPLASLKSTDSEVYKCGGIPFLWAWGEPLPVELPEHIKRQVFDS